jgi:hypothetical protein
MFPSTSDDRNGSMAATAFMVLALHEQRAHKLISSEQSPGVDSAIDRGAAWLSGQADASHARWMAYPPEQTFERENPYLAISALVMHVLRTVKGTDGFDVPWLNNLPLTIPKPAEDEGAKAYVFLGDGQFTLDDVRHYRFPWMLRVTIDSYVRGNLLGRTRASLWLDEALKKSTSVEDLHGEAWTIAEVLFALRHAQSMLTAKSSPRP